MIRIAVCDDSPEFLQQAVNISGNSGEKMTHIMAQK